MDMIQRTLQFQTDDTSEQKLEKLEHNLRQYRLPLEETVPLFASLLSLPVPEDRYPPLTLSPQRQREKTLEAIVAITLELSEQQPVLFILEDLHWVDPTTLELLELLVDQTPTASVYTLLTCRPEFQPSWSHRSCLTEVTVNRLSSNQIARMAEHVVGGKGLPTEIIQQLVDKTDGVPLYVEEMTKSVLESGVLKETNGHYELVGSISTLSIPTTLQDSLMARLDRLVTAKAVAQYASVIGRQFSYELLHAVAQLDEATLQRKLGRLVEAELAYQRGLPPQATYTFKHALIQDTAYESLLRSTRQGYHRRIAEVLAEQFPETAETQPELVAHHYIEAGINEQAVAYWRQAGEQAVQRSAYLETIGHLSNGLDTLNKLPCTRERDQYELQLQLSLALAFHASKGQSADEVEYTYLRARELCEQLDEGQQLFRVLMGLYRCYGGRGQRQTAREFVDELFRVAQRLQDAPLLLEAHMARGVVIFHAGEFIVARDHLEQAIAIYDPEDKRFNAANASINPGVNVLSRMSWTLWFLGYPEQARSKSQETLTLARQLGHIHSLAMVCTFASILHLLCGEGDSIQEQVEVATRLSSEYDFRQWKMMAAMLRGWYLAHHEQSEVGIVKMQEELSTYLASGNALYRVWFLALLAEAYGQYGRSALGLEVIGEALALVFGNEGERCWESELHHIKGKLLLVESPDNAADAESCFQQAITIAQNQSAKSWELRAATSLARLWQSQGKRKEAYNLLSPVYGWFTEGFDTADLIDARALLDELS
jgi:predicted ATPase